MTVHSSLNRLPFRTFHLTLFGMLLVILATGCGGGGPEQGSSEKTASTSAGTGSASFAIQWHTASGELASATDSAVVLQAIESCETAGVASITCKVYDPSRNQIAEGGPWNCSDHQGTIEQIPAGSNRTFSVLGWGGTGGGGDVMYQGQAANITIQPGQTTHVGTIDARPFVPDAPTMGEVYGNQINLSWNNLGAASYGIYRDGAAVGGSTSPAYSDTGLSPLTQYCYSLSAMDSFGNESGQSDQTCIETTNEGTNIYYRDADNDSYGNPDDSTQAATPPDGYVADNSDCNDNNANINPGMVEICGDNIDQDCNGSDLSCDDADNDGDGFSENQGDCNDANANVNPAATEVCNGIDDNCAGGIDEGLSTDADSDGYYATGSCLTPNDDCDDNNADINPGMDEICGDNIDQDCNGSDLSCDNVDNDGDGFSENQGDCNDANANVNPGATEVCNGIDDNCAGGVDENLTRATTCGVGACAGNTGTETCSAGVWGNDTCDPLDGARAEVCDNRDNDCDGTVDENVTRATTCGVGACAGNTGIEICSAGVWGGNTCDPLDGARAEVCDNTDNDCDGSVDESLTRATTCGVGACAGNTGTETCTAGDWGNNTCDPLDGARAEVCDNTDNDCDGSVDESLTRATTCGVGACAGNTGTETCTAGDWGNDTCDPFAGATDEVCFDDIDNDCSGVIDEGCVTANEDCIDFNPSNVIVYRPSDLIWLVMERDGNMQPLVFDDGGEAQQARDTIQYYPMNSQCFVGPRDDPSMEYWLVNGGSPSGPFISDLYAEDCLPFDPDALYLERHGNRWTLMEGSMAMLTFPTYEEGQQAMQTIQYYGFRNQCFVGRPDPPMSYWRR